MTLRRDSRETGKLYAPCPISTGQEEWRPVVGFEPYYLVSSLGRLYSLRRGIFIRPALNTKGYLRTSFSIDSRFYDRTIHRLVASTFIGDPPENTEINHKNGIKTDNRVVNLEYVAHRSNIEHAWRTGLRKNRVSTRKLSDDTILEIRRAWLSLRAARIASGRLRLPSGTLTALANRYAITTTHVYQIGSRKAWKSLEG